jgi:uncharacterized delta-60 repeat protein
MEPIMLLNRIAMYLLMIMVFLTGFLNCLRLDPISFSSFIIHLFFTKHILSDSRNKFTPAIGVLDSSFNAPHGFIKQPMGLGVDYGYSLVIQPDGKILLGGYCKNGSNYDFCIARFNSDGTLDTSFSSSGNVIQPIGSDNDEGYSLVIQPDGKILLGGYCKNGSNYDFCIARFNSDGTLDTSFSSSGNVIQPIGSDNDEGYSLVIQPDGKILLGGYCKNGSNYDFCIARFNSDGTLDTTFGSSGKVIQPIGSSNDFGRSLVIQPDGKILLGGTCYNGSNDDFCIARFNSDGTLDTTFGSYGKIIQPIGSWNDWGYSLAIQPDGKILLGGYCFGDFCIARFNSDGTLNTPFSSGYSGVVIQPIGSDNDYGYSLAIQPDGKILLGGYCSNESNWDFCIARFNSDGTLDTTFGSYGKIIQPIGSWNDWGYSLAIQLDGKILLGGYCYNGSDNDFCIARFNSDGTLDKTFGSSGIVILPIGSSDDEGKSLAIQPDGKILLGGYCSNGSNNDFCIARFKSDGTLDKTFGSSGKVIQPIGSSDDYGYSLAIQPDGKILLGGFCYNGRNNDFCIARFNSNGTLDTTFGSSGIVIQPIGSSGDNGYSLAIQPDGKILLGGSCRKRFNDYSCIARFNSDGTLDTTFGSSGIVIQPIVSANDHGNSFAIQPDGKILLSGFCRNGSNEDFCIERFNSDGTLDTTFGSRGKVIQSIGSSDDKGKYLAIQPDGKILLGGYCRIGGNRDFCIARFNSDGTLDTTFGSSGKVIQSIDSSNDYGYSLAIQPDGKILLGGSCNNGGDVDFCIARFKSDGTLDKTFGRSGIVILPIGSSDDEGKSLAIQPDGKILLGGYCSYKSNVDFCIARFNFDGTLDITFGSYGKIIQPIGSSNDFGYSIAIEPDGKILLGGRCSNGRNDDFCIARFYPNGTLDTTFGNSGKVIQPIGPANDIGRSLAIQLDGKILLGGYCNNRKNDDFCITRFNSNGTLDTTFGNRGKVIQPIGSYDDYGYSLAIQPDGKILLGGRCSNGRNDDFCIARFYLNGTLDTTFGNRGKVIQPIGSYDDYGYSLAIQPDGKILLGGYCNNRGNIDFCITCFKSDGTLDNISFGTGSKVIQDIGSNIEYGYSLAIQPDGKILLGGHCKNGSNYDFCIARFK